MTTPAIRYRVSMPRLGTHLLHVDLEVDDPRYALDLRLPVWTPGSYMIREFARHVQSFEAHGAAGQQLPWSKVRKDTWRIDGTKGDRVHVAFDVYANDLTVRTSHLDTTHAFFNAANLLPYVDGRTDEPLLLKVEAPTGWHVETGLRSADEPSTYLAADYDELVDSPVHASPDPVLRFSALGKEHRIATWGRANLDADRLTADVARIVETQAQLFDGLPYDVYLFILMNTDGGRSGLEHRNSCALMAPRFNYRPGRTYERILQLISHEFFHTWNVKRIRPVWNEGAFRWDEENYTRLLWAMEGITDYYTSQMLRRAGIMSADRYLEVLADQIRDLLDTPGRALQSLEESSFDAWIKYYRPDEHAGNSSISYYLKGALVSLLLDLAMRARTRGQRSLDDVMRLLWQRFGREGVGVPENAYPGLCEEVTGSSWAEFFEGYVGGRAELDFDSAFKIVGIDLERQDDASLPSAWLGIRTRSDGGRARLTSILSNGPLYDAGLSAGDELLAIDGYRVDEATLTDRLRDYTPGQTISLTAFHGDHLVELPVRLAERPPRITLRRTQRPSVQQRELYEAWIGSPWPSGG